MDSFKKFPDSRKLDFPDMSDRSEVSCREGSQLEASKKYRKLPGALLRSDKQKRTGGCYTPGIMSYFKIERQARADTDKYNINLTGHTETSKRKADSCNKF